MAKKATANKATAKKAAAKAAPGKKAAGKKATSAKTAPEPIPESTTASSAAPAKRTPPKKATPAKKMAAESWSTPTRAVSTETTQPGAIGAKEAAIEATAPETPSPTASAEAAATDRAASEPPIPTRTTPRAATATPNAGRPTPTAAQPLPAEEPAAEAAQTTEAWTRLLADPRRAPELLALAAVQKIGPRARDWAERTRSAYPAASDRAVARLAMQQFTRASSPVRLLGTVAGAFAPGVLLGTAAVRHAELTLHVAAAYGKDPTDPQRAAELLAIVGGRKRPGRVIMERATAWSVARRVNRLVPGTSLLAAFLTADTATQAVAARADAFYRQRESTVKAT